MDYYQNKAKAFKIIDKMLSEKKSLDEIEFKIATLFGFTRKIIDQRINMIKRVRGDSDVL